MLEFALDWAHNEGARDKKYIQNSGGEASLKTSTQRIEKEEQVDLEGIIY
jgi:hypothetical protein